MMNHNNKKKKVTSKRIRALIATVLLIVYACVGIAYAATDIGNTESNRLQNGSFEEGQTFNKAYLQVDQLAVPAWNTTAFQGKIELFRSNPSTYFTNMTLSPTDGEYAAELNADEESTLYQTVKTTPSSVYEWGIDHGARNGKDIMALVIGPKQSVDPSKPEKAGRDQFMQMVDWLNIGNNITAGAQPIKYVVYSKKFAASGTFEDNAGNNAFSLTPSTIYTEEWHIWIMASEKGTSGINPWNSYGSNAEGTAGSPDNSGNTNIDLDKYYLYTIPSGQTQTLFGFVSVGYENPITTGDRAKTYGNFLDKINFKIYHPLSGSTSTHGSVVVGGSDGTAEGDGGSDGYKVTVDSKLTTYVTDGEPLKIQAIINKKDLDEGCEFVGLHRTKLDENGNTVAEFLKLADNVIDDSGSLTDEQKKGKWIKSTNTDGDIIYTYYLEDINSPTDMHFVFIKSPTITYDPNGGKPYVVERTYNTNEAANVYSYKPVSGHAEAQAETDTIFISPYVSKAAEGDDGWKFMGWLLTGDTVDNISSDLQVNADQLGSMILPAEHTIACDYAFAGVGGDTKAQYFKIYDGNVSLTKTINNANDEDMGVTWVDNGETKSYANIHKGLTLVAQWRWLQAFIPQVGNGSTFTDSKQGGTVEITSVTNTSDTNYNAAYNSNGGKSYYAETDETVSVMAIANPGYTFAGWYDESGNLITTQTEYSYIESNGSVNTYYARFSGNVTQTYIRQVKNGSTWENTTDDKIGTLDRYSYIDAPGLPISSTATAGSGYKFVGWYDKDGNKVADNMLINNGATISYITTTDDATYYARFEKAYTAKFAAQTKQADGSFNTDTVGGKVSVTSVSDVDGATVSSKATTNSGYKFIGWYDKNGNQLSTSATYSPTITSATNNVTYYARFEVDYNPTVESKVYLAFIAESSETQTPSVFEGRDVGAGYIGNVYGNTISTGFKYSIANITNVSTIQITVNVPDTAYVKVGGKGSFMGKGNPILTDSAKVTHNKGSIYKISGATTFNYYWDVSELEAGKTYGFILDNLYAPGATATITVNGKEGTKVTSDNGVVNTNAMDYKNKSHYKR